ncbi:hypothetical protein DQ353_14555 [Arthrobacter sp. AQ5-05]|uniref:hypothetical protein n=1 Tax=Arthrobacter sp. AQ5-05 TaxID=2184581 RepID=UPI000DCEBB69|nr:hypothetical protein [Arthrobacter sp. AQ5-05]RAX48588.1 hypothetical protein DQ353_14555 [Arthrobacter sp. AQ5-05]
MMPTHAAATLPHSRPAPVHEHAWLAESTHNTSEGTVVYVRCAAGCGARRVDLQGPANVPASAVSKVVGR